MTSFRISTIVAICLGAVAARGAELREYADARYVAHDSGDGDSFMVVFDGAEHMLRLYYVDCPETSLGSNSDRRRILDQARYFGVSDARRVIEFGQQAADRTRDLLSDAEFTVHSALASAPGRSRKPRVYGMVTLPNGRDLAAVLVSDGLARTHGVGRALPDGTSSEEHAEFLRDLELAAALERRGIWSASEPGKLAALRQRQREEDRALEAQALGIFGTLSEDEPLDLNTASKEDLQQIRGIGEVLAERIIAHRPYESPDDLLRVPGIGPTLLERARPFITVTPPP